MTNTDGMASTATTAAAVDESLLKTITEYFAVNASDVTRDQLKQLRLFVASGTSGAKQLVIERNDESPNQIHISLRQPSGDDRQRRRRSLTDNTLVFVKLPSNSGQTSSAAGAEETIINETEAIGRLRRVMQRMDGSAASLMHALSELRRHGRTPEILAALRSERQDLVLKVNDWADSCADIADLDSDNMVDRISVLKAREGKLRAVIRVCDQLLSTDIDSYRTARPTLEQISRELADTSQRFFSEWHQSVRSVTMNTDRQCIELDARSQVPRVTFDPKLVRLAADAGVLRCLGFQLPADVVAAESDAKKYGGYARELREIVNFYCSVADQILLSQRPMLIGAAQRFTALLESRQRMSWSDDQNRLQAWLEELKTFAKQFGTENRQLRRHHQKVLALVRPLFDQRVAHWRSPLTDARTVVQEVDYRYENTGPWKRHWDHQLYKILEYHFNDTLIKSDHLLSFSGDSNSKSSFAFRPTARLTTGISVSGGGGSDVDQLKIELSFSGSSVAYRPPLEELKARIYGRIRTFLSLPEKFDGFVSNTSDNPKDNNNKSLFYAIYLRNFNNFPILYEKANEIVEELLQMRDQFVEWCSLYHVIRWQTTSGAAGDGTDDSTDDNKPQTLEQFLNLEALDDYKSNLIHIKTMAQKFNKQYADNELVCRTGGDFRVNIMPVKTFVDWLLQEVDKLLVRSLKDRCDQEIHAIDSKCQQVLDVVTRRPDNIDELLAVDGLLNNEWQTIQKELNDTYKSLDDKLAFLMKWSAKSAPDLTEIRNKVDEFDRLADTKTSLLDSYKEIVKSRMEVEVDNTGQEMQQLVNRWQSLSDDMRETKEIIQEVRLESDSLAEKCRELSLSCDYFSATKPSIFELFQRVADEVAEADAKWTMFHEFEAGIGKYLDMEWIVSRNKLSAIESYISKWEEDHQDAGPMLTNRVREWRELLSLLKQCRGECFVKSHWQEFLGLIGLTIDYEKLKLSDLVGHRKQLLVARDSIKELNTKASNEMSIRETFNELDLFAASAQLSLQEHETAEGLAIQVIRDWRSILNRVSECTLTLQTVKNTEFFVAGTGDLQERANLWDSRLTQLDIVLGLMNGVQRKWVSLEPIYARDDTGMFADYTFTPASRDFQDILKTVAKDPHVMRLLHVPGLEPRLQAIDRTLTVCQKKLQTFMEESRARFPRFYFLADDDLLLILAGKVEVNQSTLLKKLFNNAVCKIHMDSNGTKVLSIESPEGEVIVLRQPVQIESGRGAHGVESWLRNLETQLKSSLKDQFFDGLTASEDTDAAAVGSHKWETAAQLLSVINWVLFTQRVEDGLKRHSLPDLKLQYERELSALTTGHDLDTDSSAADSVLAIKIKSLVLDVIHFLTVLDELVAGDVRDVNDWLWQKQLRFYANKRRTNGLLSVHMGSATFEYSFEYLGCFGGAKLVHTPLTDKCYLTLTQAMDMGLGGNPYGPAGTGKTESVKALGQHLGRQVMVFNCDEAIDVKAMTRILVGLIKCGAWGCFDEFNRLQLDVLSALSSQIQAIQWAIKNKSKSVLLPQYGEVDINTFAAIFITLNPAGKQYGGRNRLPDNLKSLFLPIAMSVPDNEIISKTLLLAEGFELSQSQTLGQKLTVWFELARDCMTYQRHYDWGLRAIKTCLEASGRAIRAMASSGGGDDQQLVKDEVRLVIDTLRRQIKSKLTADDNNKFESLLGDVFGQKAVAANGSTGVKTSLHKHIIKVLEDKHLVIDEEQITKIIELDEQLRSRLGVVVVGQSGAGKSTLWKVLQEARRLVDTNCNTQSVIINPKAVSRQQLLGWVDDDTREWRDGLLTHKSREIARDETAVQYWLIFDGPIDPDWVEALNSVLDDNRILTLPTGERIDFDPKRCNILFETTSLEFASPATISRLGVVCVNGCQYPQLLSAGVREMDVRLSQDELLRYIAGSDQRLWVSLTRTLLSHMSYARQEDGDPVKGILRVQRNLQTLDVKPLRVKSGRIIQTPIIQKTLELIKPWIDSQDTYCHVLFTGPKGCGKSTLVDHTLLPTGAIVKVNCTPDTTAADIVDSMRQSLSLMSSGAVKQWRSVTNNRIILYLKNLELLSPDKWQTKSALNLLTQLITYGGLYDDQTYDWCQLSSFQVVATCTDIKYLDDRLLSLMHVVQMDVPPVQELEHIFLGKIPTDCPFGQPFIKSFTKTYRELQSFSGDDRPVDWLRAGVEILEALGYYTDVSGQVMRREFSRAFGSYFSTNADRQSLESVLTGVFGGGDDRKVVFASANGAAKLTQLDGDQFAAQIKRQVSSWVNETEIQDPMLAVVPETVDMFAECNTFLKENNTDLMAGLVLVGSSGSGRKLAVRVVSHAFGYDTVWSPKQAYNEKQLVAELNSLLTGSTDEDKTAGGGGEAGDRKVVIVVDEIHLQLIPHLRDKIYRILCEKSCKYQVRVVLVVSELRDVSELMWSRVCHVHYCPKWSSVSLRQLPKLIIPQIIGTGSAAVATIDGQDLSEKFCKIHEMFATVTGRQESRRYLSLIHVFGQILVNKSTELERRSEHLRSGVGKLETASTEVAKLRSEATEQQSLLAAKRREADDALDLITNSMHGAEDQRVELEDIRAKTERETEKLTVRKREIDAELKQIEPALLAAKQAVGSIRSESLAEIRSLRAPPEVIRDILEGVLRLMGVNDTSWVSMKSFLSRRGVKDEIMNFESRKITPDMRLKVEALLRDHSDSFEAVSAKRASVAAAPLAEWVKANVLFSRVLHKIKPLEDEQNRLESGLRSAQTRMTSLSNQLEGVETEVGALRNRLNQVTVEAAQLEVGLKQINQTLGQSERLIGDLSGEFARWRQQLQDIQETVRQLPMQALLASAYVVYAAGEPSVERRRQLFGQCCQALTVDEFDLQTFLNVSVEEQVFLAIQSPLQTPLICDPSRKLLANEAFGPNAEVTDTRSRDWVKVMELSLRFGRTLVINDFGRLEFPLLSVLRREIYGSPDGGARNWLFVGDKRVDYNRQFKLYLVGQDFNDRTVNNPLFNSVNLSPSGSGMSSSLLSLVIQCRRPELELKKLEVERQKAQLESELRELESRLLAKLMASGPGNILNNTELMSSLNQIKQSAVQAEQSLLESAKVAEDLHRERNEYAGLAQFASQVYFLVRELATLNPMYRFGVSEYERVFRESLDKFKDLTPNQLLQEIYDYVSRGLFPEDKVIFERFVRRRCAGQSRSLAVDRTVNVREFVRSLYGSDQRVGLIMTSAGSDPTGEVQQVAAELRLANYTVLSMGSDVLARAEQTLAGGTAGGQPVEMLCMTNLHLVVGWLPALTHLLITANSTGAANNKSGKQFVILCTECCPDFPSQLLEMSVKYAYESAPGLQHQLKRLALDSAAAKATPELQILSYLHAVCCERRHYVPQGWTKGYEFGFNDFRAATQIVQTVAAEKDRRLRLDFIRGLLGAVIYGGKLDTPVDDLILQALIGRWFSRDQNRDNRPDPSDEIALLGLARNVNKLRETALEDRLARGLTVLEKATDADQSFADKEFERLRSLWRQLAPNREMARTSGQELAPNGSPIDIYLMAELTQIKKLILKIDTDINTGGSDSELIGRQLATNETPDGWLELWPSGPATVDKFMRCVGVTAKEMVKLSGVSGQRELEFNLSHVLHPTALMNAMKQLAARKLDVTVDQLRMWCAWGRQSLSTGSAPVMRCTLTGLAIEGALFDGQQLDECSADSPLQSPMPALALYFLPKDSAEPYAGQQVVRVPLYANTGREVVVGHLDVPISRGTSDQRWVECAVSLVIQFSHN